MPNGVYPVESTQNLRPPVKLIPENGNAAEKLD